MQCHMSFPSNTASQLLKRRNAPVSLFASEGIAKQSTKKHTIRTSTARSSSAVRQGSVAALASGRGQVHGRRTAELSTAIWLLSQLPANAAESSVDFSKGSFSTESYVVTLGLFLISLPGMGITYAQYLWLFSSVACCLRSSKQSFCLNMLKCTSSGKWDPLDYHFPIPFPNLIWLVMASIFKLSFWLQEASCKICFITVQVSVILDLSPPAFSFNSYNVGCTVYFEGFAANLDLAAFPKNLKWSLLLLLQLLALLAIL